MKSVVARLASPSQTVSWLSKDFITVCIWTAVTLGTLLLSLLAQAQGKIPMPFGIGLMPALTLLMGLVGGLVIRPNISWKHLETLIVPLVPIILLFIFCLAVIFTFLVMGISQDNSDQIAGVELLFVAIGCVGFYLMLLPSFMVGKRLRHRIMS